MGYAAHVPEVYLEQNELLNGIHMVSRHLRAGGRWYVVWVAKLAAVWVITCDLGCLPVAMGSVARP